MSLPKQRIPGARIDTAKPISFFFDGKPYKGYAGDTLASALLANGVRILGRGFKLHRPRGLLAAGKEEPNALVQLEEGAFTEPNVRATLQPLYPGLRARGQNAWPSVGFDVIGILGFFKPLFPASFYYKTFMWPSWHWYEWAVRRLAGLGKAPRERDPQHYQRQNVHCDLLIVGAGPAGLAAALQVAPSGRRILLIDEQEEAGGSLLAERETIDGKPAMDWVKATLATLAGHANVQVLARSTVTGYYDHNVLAAVERVSNHLGPEAPAHLPRERWWRIRAAQVILASGAMERPLVFPDNDRPGVMLASAVRHYLNRYGVAAGARTVVFTCNDSAYRTAIDLAQRGVAVAAVVDTRAGGAGELGERVRGLGIAVHTGHRVLGTRGRRGLRAVRIAPHAGGAATTIACDVLAVSGGWSPVVHLFSQSGGSLRFDEGLQAFVPERAVQAVAAAGAAAGVTGLAAALAGGAAAARTALEAIGVTVLPALAVTAAPAPAERPLEPFWFTPGAAPEYQWLDFQYDVTVADIALAARENFVSVEHVKRYTTNGMSVDQGKTSNINALAVLASSTGRAIPEVGTTRFRPPYHPVTLGAIAGRGLGERYAPRLETPIHERHLELGAQMDDYGGWQRPACYLQPGEDEHRAVLRETREVRRGLALFDGSPLGKIEVRGPDAAEFLERVYINSVRNLAPGRARYGLMLNELGIVIDDGVLVRLAEDHFLVHTTSGGSGRIFLMLEEWLQCEWTTLRVRCTNVTTQWATVTLSGRGARDLLAPLVQGIDLGREAFPHMHFRSGSIAGVPARILRASFTGEASYEISVPANRGLDLWDTLHQAGSHEGIVAFGLEALLMLRAEKGYLHVGADTDGTTNPLDLGWGPVIAKKQSDFIGRRSLSTPNATREGRLCFCGIEPLDPSTALPIGAHVLDTLPGGTRRSGGYVTSSCFSPELGGWIGLGIVRDGPARAGEIVTVAGNGIEMQARLRGTVYIDPEGERLHA